MLESIRKLHQMNDAMKSVQYWRIDEVLKKLKIVNWIKPYILFWKCIYFLQNSSGAMWELHLIESKQVSDQSNLCNCMFKSLLAKINLSFNEYEYEKYNFIEVKNYAQLAWNLHSS